MGGEQWGEDELAEEGGREGHEKTGKEQPEDQERLIDVAKRTERSNRDSEHPPGLAI